MRTFRFNIKSLLLLTLVLTLVICFFAKPYVDARSERAAIVALENDWEILVDSDAFLGRTNGTSNTKAQDDPWYHWPAKKLVGNESLQRVRHLRLVGPLNSEFSLRPLRELDKVTHLTFNWNPQALSKAQTSYIGAMKNLIELSIGCECEGGFQRWRHLPMKRLYCSGPEWSQEEFDAIGDIEFLESLRLRTIEFTQKNLAALAKLTKLNNLSLVVGPGQSIVGLDVINHMPSLAHLSLSGSLSADELEALSRSNRLVTISLIGSRFDEQKIRELSKNTKLKHIDFGHMQISVQTYDLLVDAGIEVGHSGLTGDELAENYFLYNQIYYPVDIEKSSLAAYVEPGSEDVTWTIDVRAAKKPRHDWDAIHPPCIEHYGFQCAKDWHSLVGFQSVMENEDWYDESGNFYDGIHLRANDHHVEFLSRNGNQFHIKWTSLVGDTRQEARKTTIDTTIPLCGVIVKNYKNDISLELAKEAVGKFFDLDEFSRPVFTGHNDALIQFTLKDGVD